MNGFLELVAEVGPGVVVRATALFAVAAVVSLAVARASAAQRHFVWVAALLGALALPAIHAWAPAWPVWPAALAGRPATLPAGTESTPRFEPAPPGSPDSPVADVPVALYESRGAEPAASHDVSQTVPVASPPTAAAARTVSLAHGLATVWLVGVCYGCARLAAAYAGIRQLARRADPVGGRTAALLADLAAAAGIRRRVRGLVSRESIVPMTWGWLRPVVLLPAEAGSWSAERLRVVLQHELAHVSRWDALTQFVAELARSVYWFHPLAWWSVRRLRADQEAACDDCVLAAGAAADDYAEELLAVTAGLPRTAYGLQGTGVAVAMGRAGQLEERVRALLAFDRDRRPVNPWRAAAVAGVFAAVATLAAVIGPAADAEAKAASSPAKPDAKAAGDLPADTNKITSLTPEQARKLLDGRRWVQVATPLIRGLTAGLVDTEPRFNRCLMLSGLKHLDADTAAVLASFRGGELRLDGLESLAPDVAMALAVFSGILRLDGLKTLDAATAAAFEPAKILSLGGLVALDAPTAKELSRGKGFLCLDGVTAIDVAVAAALAAREGGLSLGALIARDADALEALAGFRGQWLLLHCPQPLTKQLAAVLAGYKGSCLVLTGLTTLDAGEADWIADLQCQLLYLEDVTNIREQHARALAAFKGKEMFLPGVTSLDASTARLLAAFQGRSLHLDGLKNIDADTATHGVRVPSLL